MSSLMYESIVDLRHLSDDAATIMPPEDNRDNVISDSTATIRPPEPSLSQKNIIRTRFFVLLSFRSMY
jgi:hypothetical protein